MRRCFLVTCKQGHYGNRRYQPITFAFIAKDAITAMDMAKSMPSVKHDNMVLECREISYAEYMKYRKVSAYRRVDKW